MSFWRTVTDTTDAPFLEYLDGMPDMGQGAFDKDGGWTDRQWRKAPIKRVRLTDLIATNRDGYLNERAVARYVRSRNYGLPYVVEYYGELYVADGHHRVTAAYRLGETCIKEKGIQVG